VALTHAGKVFYERVRRLPEAGEEAGAAARRAARGEQGRLAVGFVGSATYELLPGVVRAHHERYPEVTLDLHGEMLTAAQLDGLLDGSLAVGVLRRRRRPRALSWRCCARRSWSRCCRCNTRRPGNGRCAWRR